MERGRGGVLPVCLNRAEARSSSAAAVTDPDQAGLNNMTYITLLVRMEPLCCCLHLSTWVQMHSRGERLAEHIFVS